MIDLTTYYPDNNKKIIFRILDIGSCGGIGDRLLGLCSSFILSLILNFEFRIYWTYPINIDKILDENIIKWNKNDYNINEINNDLGLIDNDMIINRHILYNNIYEYFNKSMTIISNKAFYLYLFKNTYIKNRLLELNIINQNDIIHNCMNILFKFKYQTRIKYNILLYNFSKYYTIGLQVRSFIGEFYDKLDINKLIPYYNFIEDNYKIHNNLQVYLCSDSANIITHFINKYKHIKFIITANDIIHLELSKDNNMNIDNNLKLILEIYTLGKTQQLLITYNSNFGRISALINKKIPYINNGDNYILSNFESILSKDIIN